MATLEGWEMPKLSLMFDNKLVREVPVGNRPVTIGRAPDNDLSVDNLMLLSGNTDQKEYILTNKLTVIGKSPMATVKLKGWFKPQMAVQINQRDDGYFLGPGDKVPSVNGRLIGGPTRLNDGDLIEVSGVKLNFIFRE